MESNSDQELFEIFAAIITNSPYPKVIFTVDYAGVPKSTSDISWEAAISEEQGYVPVIATRNNENTGWIFFSKHSGYTGFLKDGVFDM